MYKHSLLFLATLTSLTASYEAYDTKPSSKMMYFVKLGAFTTKAHASAWQQSIKIPTYIISLGKYYSVVSAGSLHMAESKTLLKKLKPQYPDAYIITLFQQHPKSKEKAEKVEEESDYKKGVYLYHDKQYEAALVLFDRVLIEDEEDINALMFYAKTLFHLEIMDEAKKSFNLLLKKDISDKQKEQVDRYLDAIDAKKRRHVFKTTLSLGMGYDDNVNLSTDIQTTKYGTFTLQNDTHKTDSTFGTFALTVAHQYKADSFDIISTFYSYNEFLHSAKGNDLNYIDFSTGMKKGLGDWSFWLPLGANISYLDGEEIGYNLYTSPLVAYHINPAWTLSLQGTYLDNTSTYMRKKDYTLVCASSGLRYQNLDFMLGIGVGYDLLTLKESYRYDMDKDSLSSKLYGRYNIRKNSFIAGDIAYKEDGYTYVDPIMGYAREDKIIHFGLSFGQVLKKHSLLSFGVHRIENDSNINAYTYDKNSYILQYNYTF
jgi:tetratricopeptide (TPR) repeat protein